MSDTESLEAWIERQLAVSSERLLASVSATGLSRPGPRVGQVMVPAPGSVLAYAQPQPGPDEPDYFFHWIRDAALIVDALVTLYRQGRLPAAARRRFAESVAFDRRLLRIDGRALVEREGWPPEVYPQQQPWLRPGEEVVRLRGRAVLDDVRYNADGTPDVVRWSRPQHDGPAKRALTTLKLLQCGALEADTERRQAALLLAGDLGYTLSRHARPSYDPWEEELGFHFYTRLLQHAAMRRGAAWAAATGRPRAAGRLAAAAAEQAVALAGHWSAADGLYGSRLPGPGISAEKNLDSIVLLAVLHAGLADGPFSVLDPKVAATVERLEAFFAGYLPINAGREASDGVLLGRYAGDRYFEGGAFPIACFGLAEFHYRRAATGARNEAPRELARGDAVLGFTRRFLPASGRLPEQLDRVTGAPRSARDLSWSHAALVTAADARAAARSAAG